MSDLTEEDKQRINNALINTIRNNVKKEYSCGKIQDNDSVTDWCNIDCELSQKYKFVNIHNILYANVKTAIDMTKVYGALQILERYAANLLKPENERPSAWRTVMFKNTTFEEKVDCIKGAREILQSLGYAATSPADRFYFPDNSTLNMDKVKMVATELALAQQEMKQFLSDSHGSPHRLRSCIPSLRVVEANLGSGDAPDRTIIQSGGDCQLCGGVSLVQCSKCAKQFCAECDAQWHLHPSRRNHKITIGGPLPDVTRDTAPAKTVISYDVTVSPIMNELKEIKSVSSKIERLDAYMNQLNERINTLDTEISVIGLNNNNFVQDERWKVKSLSRDRLIRERNQLRKFSAQLKLVAPPPLLPKPDLKRDVTSRDEDAHCGYQGICPRCRNVVDYVKDTCSECGQRFPDSIATISGVKQLRQKHQSGSARPPALPVLFSEAWTTPEPQRDVTTGGARSLMLEAPLQETQSPEVRMTSSAAERRLSSSPSSLVKHPLAWSCEHCTMENASGTGICKGCDRTSQNPTFIAEEASSDDDFLSAASSPIDPKLEAQETPVTPVNNVRNSDMQPSKAVDDDDAFQDEPIYASIDDPIFAAAKDKLEIAMEEAEMSVAEQLRQEQNYGDSKSIINLFRYAENHDGSVDGAALMMDMTSSSTIRDYKKFIEEDWPVLLDSLIDSVSEFKLSNNEAADALIECNGDILLAQDQACRIRQEKVDELMSRYDFSAEEVVLALNEQDGDLENAYVSLLNRKLQDFRDRMTLTDTQSSGNDVIHDGIYNHDFNREVFQEEHFLETLKNPNVDEEKKTRMVLVEGNMQGWKRAQTVLQLLQENLGDEVNAADIVEAVRETDGTPDAGRNYLQHECSLCFSLFPVRFMRVLTMCSCEICHSCMAQHFSLCVREKQPREFVCPSCQLPDLDDLDVAERQFNFLTNQLHSMIDAAESQLFTEKLAQWRLQQDPFFRWCSHCPNGFVGEGFRKMKCPNCKQFTCFDCKKQWQEQHEGITCEQFSQWQKDNDPDYQSQGLKRHLEENGIECPKCKMRYALAKGGCMHFTCTQCKFEFCCGCAQPFLRTGICKRYAECKGLGLHCHHPRDCLYHLRDHSVEELTKLLTDNNHELPEQPDHTGGREVCHVLEQKETPNGLKDEQCGKKVYENAGLCETHVKEYLVGLINGHRLDPIQLLDLDQVRILHGRERIEVPPREQGQTDDQYHQLLKENLMCAVPLPNRGAAS